MAQALLVARVMRLALVTFVSLLAACGPDGPEDGPTVDGGPGGTSGTLDIDWHPTHAPALALAADSTHVYYATHDRIQRVPVSGGEAEVLYAIPPAGGETLFRSVSSLYLGPDEVVFVLSATQMNQSTTKSLLSVPRTGGAATTLAQSGDVRAFLGVSFDAEYVYYSSFTSLVRVPRAGGMPRFVGNSDQSVRYWMFSPVVTAETIDWAEGGALYRMAKSDVGGEGQAFAELPGVGAIIAREPAYVVALSDQIAFQSPPSSAVVVDPATGAVGPELPLPGMTSIAPVEQTVAASPEYLWAASIDGLWQTSRSGGAPARVLDGVIAAVTAGPDGVYAATQTAIVRSAP